MKMKTKDTQKKDVAGQQAATIAAETRADDPAGLGDGNSPLTGLDDKIVYEIPELSQAPKETDGVNGARKRHGTWHDWEIPDDFTITEDEARRVLVQRRWWEIVHNGPPVPASDVNLGFEDLSRKIDGAAWLLDALSCAEDNIRGFDVDPVLSYPPKQLAIEFLVEALHGLSRQAARPDFWVVALRDRVRNVFGQQPEELDVEDNR